MIEATKIITIIKLQNQMDSNRNGEINKFLIILTL